MRNADGVRSMGLTMVARHSLARAMILGLSAGLGLVLSGTASRASDLPSRTYAPAPVVEVPTYDYFFNEVRVGGFAHGVGTPERGSADVNAEILTRQIFKLEDPSYQPWVPRLHLGGMFNTSNGTSYGYAGLTWTYDILPRVFIEGSFGASLNDGKTGDRFTPFDRAKLGCHGLFRESASLGYRLTEHWSIMATVDHISNGGLCDYNRGLNNYGARIGYTF